MKMLSQYSVNLRRSDFDEMYDNGIIEDIIDGFYAFCQKPISYDVGLLTYNKWLVEKYII